MKECISERERERERDWLGWRDEGTDKERWRWDQRMAECGKTLLFIITVKACICTGLPPAFWIWLKVYIQSFSFNLPLFFLFWPLFATNFLKSRKKSDHYRGFDQSPTTQFNSIFLSKLSISVNSSKHLASHLTLQGSLLKEPKHFYCFMSTSWTGNTVKVIFVVGKKDATYRTQDY